MGRKEGRFVEDFVFFWPCEGELHWASWCFFLTFVFDLHLVSLYAVEVSHFFRVETIWCSKLHFAMDIK